MTESGNDDGAHAGAPGRQLAYWLGDVLRREREGTGDECGIGIRKGDPISLRTIAGLLDDDPMTLRRREEGVKEKGVRKYTFGQDVDKVVAAYAYVLGYDDPRILWLRALQLWQAKGAVPDYVAEFPGTANVTPLARARQAGFARALRDEARRQTQPRVAPSEKPSSNRRKRRGAQ